MSHCREWETVNGTADGRMCVDPVGSMHLLDYAMLGALIGLVLALLLWTWLQRGREGGER